ncbi:GRIP and coiled-coil domain-containing protein 2 [Lissotriton helveticus]
MEDAGQEGVASPATPGTGKSKLDTLPKEDLIKFAKKQVIILQKVKSRCTELEKEVEELKSKTPKDGTDDVIQALTDRLDAVLLEKAEAQQQLVTLKKENGKIKLEAEEAAKKTVELQDKWEKSSADRHKEIESHKNELEMLRSSHRDEVCMLQQKLQESAEQQLELEEKMALHSNQQDSIKRLEKELQQMRPTYEAQILHLNKQLEAATKDQNLESKGQEHHQVAIADLRNEFLKLRSAHQEEVSNIVYQLETHGKEYEQEKIKVNKLLHDITEQFLSKEKSIQEMLAENNVKYEQEIILLRAGIGENKNNFKENTEVPTVSSLETEAKENVEHLDNVLKENKSQLSILRDELTYTNNVKLKLELDIKHLKDEFFHEREDLEFKINELQLAKEDCGCLIETLQFQLHSANEKYEVMIQSHNQEVLALREQHKKEIWDLKEKLMSNSEQEKASLIFEIKVLKEQCEQILHEKEDAVFNYESLKETLVTLQNELGESAGKISREFKSLKEQQATDLQELQQKLRTAYNEKDALLETVNSLKAEIESLSAKHADYEEINQSLSGFQARNEEIVISLQQKDELLKELEERLNNLGLKNIDLLTSLEASREELSKLQDICTREQACVLELQQNTEALTRNNNQLKLQCEEWVEKLKEAEIEKDQNVKQLAEIENEFVAVRQERDNLVSDVQFLNMEVGKLNEEKSTMRRDIDGLIFERGDDLALREQIETLLNKLQLVSAEKEELSTLYAKGQQQKLLDEEKLLSKIQALQDDVGRLIEEKKAISRDFERFMSERDGPLAVKEHIENLNNKLQLGNEENNELQRDQQKKMLNDEKILSEVQALCIDVENLCEEKERLSNVFERDQRQKLFNEKKLLTEVQALHIEVEHLSQEKEKLTKDIENLVSERDYFLSNKEECVNLQNKLQLIAVEKDHLSKLYEKEQHQKLFTEEKFASEVQALQLKVEQLLEEKATMSCDIKRFAAEREDSMTAGPQIEDLQDKLQLAVTEKEQVSTLFENEQQQKLLIVSRLSDLLVQMDSMPPEENKDIIAILEAVHESIARLKKESQTVFQSNERCLLLQQDLERLQEEKEAHVAELKSLIEDYANEHELLKAKLEATVSEKESVKGDLLDMKSANEKSKLENLDLLARIEEFTKKVACHESQVKDQQEQSIEAVQKNMEDLPEQKESDLCNSSPECMFIKDSVDKPLAVESNQLSVITELQLKIVNLEKISKEKEEKLNKFKGVAVKAKKELDSSRKEVHALKEDLESVKNEKSQLSTSLKELIQGAESYKNLLVEYDKQAELLDVAKERAEYSERQIEELTKQLQAAYQQLEKLNSEKEDLLARIETLQTNTRLLESQILDLHRSKTSVDKELEAEKLLKEQKAKDHIAALKQIEDIQTQLQKEKKQAQVTMHELELLRKDAQKSTLMDMEMADYDRLVKELNQKISDKNSRLEDLEQEIGLQKRREETLNEEIASLQASVEQYEERSTKMKQLLLKTKKELSDSKQAETDHLLLQASLKGELEANQQQVESFKIQVAELTAEKHRLQEQLRTCMEQQQRNTNAYQQKIASLQDAYTMAKADQAAVSGEFESYKVRVHNVFKQQKNKSSSQIENEAVKQEREHLEMMLEQLKHKLQDSQHNLQINTTELQTLQVDHDTLLERHNKMLQETVAKEAELREKLCTVQSENMVMKSEHAQILSQLTAQNEALRNNFRDQIRHMQEDHRKAIETLQQQLSKLEGQLFQQQSESSITSPLSSQPPMKTLRERRATDLPILDMYIAAREEGEGMEMTDTDSVSSASTYLPPLEQLLNSPESKFEPPLWQPELSKEELVQKLNSTSKSIDHLSGLLHETEATNAILMEQITLLKNEIRRLERNQERDKSVSNLEYLKNVLLQFIFLKAGSERQRLLPVIDTMLHLSPEEKGKLVAIALGEEEAAARPAGWASYLHSWSGLR